MNQGSQFYIAFSEYQKSHFYLATPDMASYIYKEMLDFKRFNALYSFPKEH